MIEGSVKETRGENCGRRTHRLLADHARKGQWLGGTLALSNDVFTNCCLGTNATWGGIFGKDNAQQRDLRRKCANENQERNNDKHSSKYISAVGFS